MNSCILALGSNRDRNRNVGVAVSRLKECFERVYLAEPILTEPFGVPATEPFLNLVIVAYTIHSREEVIQTLKQIEKEMGRTPEDKISGSVPIDIDLLKWNDEVLKPEDMARDYVVAGVRSIIKKHFG